jgi:cytidylate kinase
MTVIALTQEMGSLAKDVAEKLAADLGLQVMRHEVVDHVSSRLHVPTSLIHRLREGKAGALERLRADRGSLAVYMTEEVLDVAARGNVVLRGWGATCLLRPVPHVVCVRVTRSMKKRVEWLMEHLETDDAEFAEAEIRRSDQAHSSRMNDLYGVTWGDPRLYDLVLNTDRISVESCVEQIATLVRRPEFAETPQSKALLANMTLEARIQVAFKDHAATDDISITVNADEGKVTLQGIVLNNEERSQAELVAAGVAGVVSVDNQLRLMASSRRFASAKY